MARRRISVPGLNSWLGRDFRAAVVAVALVAPGCGGGEAGDASSPPPVRGDRLVVGATAEDWGVLVVPRRGGRAELRALDDPARTLWSGRTTLPPTLEARVLDGGTVALRTEEGTVERYDPAVEAVTEIGRVGEDALWWEGTGGVGAWVERESGSALFVSAGDAWRAPVPAGVLWAAPLGGTDLAAIIGGPGAGRPVVLAAREGPDPVVGTARGGGPAAAGEDGAAGSGPEPPPLRPPALVTGFGRRLAAVGGDGRSLVVLSLPELETLREIEFDAPVRAAASSSSSHEFYVALGSSPTRLAAYDRLAERSRTLARIEGEVSWIRPAVLGGGLLVGGEAAAWTVRLEGGEAMSLPGRPGPDLPLGLPGGRVLLRIEGAVAVWTPGAGEGGRTNPVTGSADAWWLPVRWRPPAPARVATAGAGDGDPTAEEGEPLAPEPDPAGPDREATAAAEEPAVGAPGEPGAEPRDAPVASPDLTPEAVPPEPGFYAIVSSSQRREAIAALVARLAETGFAADIQRHRDEAGELWFRAMVGPYETREQAEAAARQLRRERGLQAWISEVGPDVRPAELLP